MLKLKLKSRTYWGSTIQAMLGLSLVWPQANDVIWGQLLLTGLPVPVVAGLKVFGMFMALFLTWYGRNRAIDWRQS